MCLLYMNNSTITNETITPLNKDVVPFIIRAIKRHFSSFINIGTMSINKYDCTIPLINSSFELNITYRTFYGGGLISSSNYDIPFIVFKTYGELKKAIRSMLIYPSTNNSNINNGINNSYNNINNLTPTPKDNKLIRFIKKAVKEYYNKEIDINSLNDMGTACLITDKNGYHRIAIYYEGYIRLKNGTSPFNTYGELVSSILTVLNQNNL